jgi:hypothetical protein
VCNVSSDCTTSLCVGVCATCAVDADCGSGRYCEGGNCKNKKGLGSGCVDDNQCQSNNCSGSLCGS